MDDSQSRLANNHVSEDGRIPILLAVTGHRDCKDPDTVVQTIRLQIQILKRNHPSSPFLALSPLAEGGDRIFAEAALAEEIPLIVLLPLPQLDYERDFPDTLTHFRYLLGRAREVFTLPYVPGNTSENTKIQGAERDFQYAQVGFYAARRANIMFALWDGKESQYVGGTADVVRFRRTGLSNHHDVDVKYTDLVDGAIPRISVLDLDWYYGMLCHVNVDREVTPPTDYISSNRCDWHPLKLERLAELQESLKLIDHYNNTIKKISQEIRFNEAQMKHYQIEGEIYSQFLAADWLANSKINSNRKVFRLIFLLAGLQAIGLEVYSETWKRWPPLFFYLVCLFVITILVAALRWRKRNELAIDYRVLAEGLRVQRFWRLAGLPNLVTHHYLRRHAGELRWVRAALQSTSYGPPNQDLDVEYIQKNWLKDQIEYFDRSVHRRAKITRRLRRLSSGIFCLGVILACSALVAVWSGWMPDEASPLHGPMLIGMSILPTAAGLIAGYIASAAHQEDVREHHRLLALFHTASEHISKSPAGREALLLDLGCEALAESANWAALHKAHEPEIIKG